MNNNKRGRGRPKKYNTEEERKEAIRISQRSYEKKNKRKPKKTKPKPNKYKVMRFEDSKWNDLGDYTDLFNIALALKYKYSTIQNIKLNRAKKLNKIFKIEKIL
jgi:hypothetical protein